MTMMRSGYISGQPIVEGLTPWVGRRIAGESAGDWPPDIDADRLSAYESFEALIRNQPSRVFASRLGLRPDQTDRLILALSLPELICNVWADGLYGENAPDVTFADDAIRTLWDGIWQDNGGDDVLGWETVFGAAFSGSAIEHVYRDEDGEVHIEEISPSIFFPRLRPGSSRHVEAVTLAWQEDRPDGDRLKTWQVRKDYEVESGQLTIRTRERELGNREFRQVDEFRPDGVDFLPFVDMHAKRWRGRYWGMSELERNLTLFAETDATLSRLATVLDYHGEPTLQVPASVMFGGVLPKGADRVIGIRNPEDGPIARYITFDGQIDGQMRELDRIVDLILQTSEIDRGYVGQGTGEGSAPSGTALRLKLQGTVKKWGRWQRKDASRIVRLADMALRLAGVDDERRREATYQAGSPLPIDDEQEVRILSMMLKDGTISRKTYMQHTRRFDDVEEELEQIADEQSETSPTSGFGLPEGTPMAPRGTPAGLAVELGIPPEQRTSDTAP